MKRGLSVGVAALVAGVAFGGNVYDNGITFPADVPAVGEFGMDHGHAVLSPDGTNPGVIDVTAASGVIDAPLTDLEFDSDDLADGVTAATFLPTKGSDSLDNRRTGAPITYWKNRSLSDIKSVRAIIAYGGAHVENVARTCFFRNDGQTATVQFQSRMSYEKNEGCGFFNLICCKVEFSQEGNDVAARIVYARYVNNTNNGTEAYDFDRGGSLSEVYDGNVWKSGYGIRAIEAGGVGADGKGGKGILVRGNYPPLAPPLPTATDKDNLPRWKNLKLSDIEGFIGESRAGGSAWEAARAWFLRSGEDATGPYTTAIFERYSDLGDAASGSYITIGKVRFRQDGDDVTVEHYSSGYRYVRASDDTHIPYDADNKPFTGANGSYPLRNIVPVLKKEKSVAFNGMLNLSGPIRLDNATVTIGSPAFASDPGSPLDPVIAGAGVLRYYRDVSNVLTQYQGVCFGPAVTNTYSGMTIFDGCETLLKGELALPKTTKLVVITNGATVATSVDGHRHITLNGAGGLSLFVYSGSTFRMEKANNLASDPHLFLFGGTFECNNWYRYMGNIVLSDGGRILKKNGGNFRLGNEMSTPLVVSLGSGTNEIQADIQLYGAQYVAGKQSTARDREFIRFYTEGDLLISGSLIKAGDAPYQASRLRKAGPATLTLSGSDCTHTSNWAVVGGTLNLASANAMTVQNGITLDGGSLKTSAASVCAFLETSNTVANVEFAQGGSLTLADASALKIGAGGLTVSGVEHPEDGIPLRVGESACLSPAQLRSIRCLTPTRRLRVYQRDDGYLAASIGCVLILR